MTEMGNRMPEGPHYQDARVVISTSRYLLGFLEPHCSVDIVVLRGRCSTVRWQENHTDFLLLDIAFGNLLDVLPL